MSFGLEIAAIVALLGAAGAALALPAHSRPVYQRSVTARRRVLPAAA
jgi:hypothetical protein